MLNRRAILSSLAAYPLLIPSLGSASTVPGQNLPSPRFLLTRARPPKFVAGLRPFRSGSYRLETETVGQKFVVHNYGHGGAGITMSWGCAAQVRDLVSDQRATVSDNKIAVLGAGVMGMTAATLLKDAGFDVALYAEKFTPYTTSDIAGGQWAPSVVDHDDEDEFIEILKASYEAHSTRGPKFGVSNRDNFTFNQSSELDYAAKAGAGMRETVDRLPFAQITHGGFRYPTLLVEPPILMRRLHSDLRQAGVKLTKKTFNKASDLADLQETVVVNCLGLGAREVWDDTNMKGIKGTLAWLPPQPGLNYLYSGIGYLFPRQDHLVVGGSLEDVMQQAENELPDPHIGYLMIKIVKAVFQGALPAPRWLSGIGRLSDGDMR